MIGDSEALDGDFEVVVAAAAYAVAAVEEEEVVVVLSMAHLGRPRRG